MSRLTAACLAACLSLAMLLPPVSTHAQAARPFPVVSYEAPARRSHTWAYVTLASGAGLIGISFAFEHRADDAYNAYLASTDVRVIDQLYDRAALNDHLSQVSVLTGEALIAAGLYMRFLRHPTGSPFSLDLRPMRCAVALRF